MELIIKTHHQEIRITKKYTRMGTKTSLLLIVISGGFSSLIITSNLLRMLEYHLEHLNQEQVLRVDRKFVKWE